MPGMRVRFDHGSICNRTGLIMGLAQFLHRSYYQYLVRFKNSNGKFDEVWLAEWEFAAESDADNLETDSLYG